MKLSDIKNHAQIQPFKPFTICTDDGHSFHVPHADFLLFVPAVLKSNTFMVVDTAGGVHFIDVGHVTRIDYPAAVQVEQG